MNPGVAISLHAAFEPQYVIAEQCLVARDAELLRIMIEIDATGNRMTATGRVELPASDNRIVQGRSYEGTGDRMMVASDRGATPTSSSSTLAGTALSSPRHNRFHHARDTCRRCVARLGRFWMQRGHLNACS